MGTRELFRMMEWFCMIVMVASSIKQMKIKKKRKVDVTILTSNKVDFRAKEEGHFIMMKESICQRNVRILKYYAPNNIASPYI